MMKAFYYLCLFAGLTFGTLTFTACGDDDGDSGKSEVPNSTSVTTDDLIGTWTINSTDNDYVAVFTKNQVTITSNGVVEIQANYTIKNNKVVFSGNNDATFESASGLLYGKSVLVLKQVSNRGDGEDENLGMILYKQGKTVTATSQDIQGFWCWYEQWGEDEIIRSAIKIEGNNFELTITPWGERYIGTYTYANGFIHLNVTQGLTSREEHTGSGSLWGRMDPKTLECDDWRTLDRENWHVDAMSDNPFIANGDEAYGFVANIPSIFSKKK